MGGLFGEFDFRAFPEGTIETVGVKRNEKTGKSHGCNLCAGN